MFYKEKETLNKYYIYQNVKYSLKYFLEEYSKFLEIINNEDCTLKDMSIAFNCIIHVMLNCLDDNVKNNAIYVAALYNQKILEKLIRENIEL